MPVTRLAPLTLDGWYVLHQGFRISWPRLKDLPEDYRREAVEELAGLLEDWESPEAGGWSGAYRMIGGALDLMLLHFRPTLDDLADAERALKRTDLSDLLYLEMDYLSVVELGLYRLTAEKVAGLREAGIDPRSREGREALRDAAEEHGELGYVEDRLHPRQPEDMPYLCFYPMDKRREPGQNWYTLTLEERNDLMVEHGGIGRNYAGRVSQVISGSVGFDDWEWGVTLWTGEPLDFKELVTEMRYDEVSAVYAEFGPFFVGRRLGPDALVGELC